ncbi:MAG: GNAT family N-acetyltransferase [Chloroflexi bacterium]|nr:GNAT family N-acetyltransferase [Chloroflexota bacterium]
MVRIERATIHDMAGVYRVCLLQGEVGADASALYRDPDLLGHIYAGPYVARGIGTQLVLVDEAGVAGYLLSADDTLDFEAWAETTWYPPLRARYPLGEGSPDDSKDAELIRLIHEPERTPRELLGPYPAHLHIDLMPRTRGLGLGRTLIDQLLAELRERGVPGVHLGVDVANTNAIGFYRHLGFEPVVDEPDTLILAQRLD